VVVVEAVDLTEPDVDRVPLAVPVRRDGTLVVAAQHGLISGYGH
jgi:hypothetical protein